MIDEMIFRQYTEILKEELKPSLGCTEPIAIAYCTAYAKKVLGKAPERCDLYCTGSVIKNANIVTVPQTGGLKGIEAAALAGLFGGDAERELEVLSSLTQADREEIRNQLGGTLVKIHLDESDTQLRIEARLRAGTDTASVEIIHWHTEIGNVFRNGVCLKKRDEQHEQEEQRKYAGLNIHDILEFSEHCDLAELSENLCLQIHHNSAIAKEGLTNDWGARVGKTILSRGENSARTWGKALASAGSDARMSGCAMPVVICGGSGNQGLTVSLPVIAFAQEKNATQEQLMRALCVSNLVSLRQKTEIGRLSAYCGVVCAATGAIAGIGYLNGDGYDVISASIVNSIACIGGMVCDGAKSSCADKIAIALECAYLGYDLASNGDGFQNGEGLVKSGVEETINSIGRMARCGMAETNREILDIMLE